MNGQFYTGAICSVSCCLVVDIMLFITITLPFYIYIYIYKGKVFLLQARCGPEGG